MVYAGFLEGDLPGLKSTLMIGNNAALKGGNTRSKKDVLGILQLAVRAGVKSWVEIMPMKCVDAIEGVERGEQRDRIVL